MKTIERRKKIVELLSDNNDLPVTKISKLLEVSVVTIRNDLNSLADEGLIVRTHGGALPAFHKNILDRQKSMVEEKNRIAKAAAQLVNDGDKIMIIAGTTAVLMAKYLLGKRDVHIITNSTLILPYARVNPSLHVTVVGGEFKSSAEGIVGALALKNLEQFHVQTAFLGADGFSLKTGVTADLLETAEVGRKMAENSGKRVLLADSSKYGKAGFALIVPINRMDLIITDNKLAKKEMELLKENGLSIMTV
ncbi:MAG: DeoR/GlpR family DNA-binding transcription regulator [Kiritimatiellae bacterium]|nr:DeoR/GlpR family DNA-binding transcription regulator [Kiritimatiellia bacterium]MDD5523255.1 DeoR/GlpR family DNA-binding transcription regulator [Kiritimatiellia bacterium]